MTQQRKTKLRSMTVFQIVLSVFLLLCLVFLIKMRYDLKRLEEQRQAAQGQLDALRVTVDQLQDYANKALDGNDQLLEDWLIQNGYR
jgi:cell division protein FtsB